MKIAVVGVTGLVGREMLRELEESKIFFSTELVPVASLQSVGNKVKFSGESYRVVSIGEGLEKNPDIALFSAGSGVSKEWASLFAENNIPVIDNSSAFRMDDDVPLVVPEINPHVLARKKRIIANPNCSTIQMVVPLFPLHQRFTIRRIVVSTYQSVSGTGYGAVKQLENERKGIEGKKSYPHRIDMNVLPQAGDFAEMGYTTEEMKLVNETRKILENNNIRITATAVRVPVMRGHSEAVNVEFEREFSIDEIYDILNQTEGVIVEDDVNLSRYPMPLIAEGKKEIYVGRVRRDFSNPNTLNMWIVGDNLLKGAATNAVQIAEYLVKNKLV